MYFSLMSDLNLQYSFESKAFEPSQNIAESSQQPIDNSNNSDD